MLRIGEGLVQGGESQVSISDCRIVRSTTQEMMDEIHRTGVYDPLADGEKASTELKEKRKQWAAEGSTVVFTSGVFDLLHQNHRAYLLHTKLEAVPIHFDKEFNGKANWEDLSEDEKKVYCQGALLGGKIRLVVSVDGDEAVASRKGGKAEKGGTPRPLFTWQTRARDVLGATTAVTGYTPDALRVPIADAVTMHDNVAQELVNTPHDDILSIAHFVDPDVWSVYYESQDIIDRLKGPEGANFTDLEAVVLPGHEFYVDSLLGGRFSTTAITKRIIGSENADK